MSVLFWACALASVATGFGVFRVSSMARATFALLASFALAAVDIALLQLSYLVVLVVLVVLMMVMECS